MYCVLAIYIYYICIYIFLSIQSLTCLLFIYLQYIKPPHNLFIYICIYRSIFLSIYPSIHICIFLSIYLKSSSLRKIKLCTIFLYRQTDRQTLIYKCSLIRLRNTNASGSRINCGQIATPNPKIIGLTSTASIYLYIYP